MNRNTRGILLESLASTIADYRQGEIEPITVSHVDRWLNQFDIDDQLIILAEMDTTMKRFYFSRVRVKAYVRNFVIKHVVGTNKPIEVLPHVSFLCTQIVGSSQDTLLDIINDVLHEEYGLTLEITATQEVQKYIYVDDGIYTGNRIRYDLTDGRGTIGWFSNCTSKCTLIVYTIAAHKAGLDYARQHLTNSAQKKQITIQRYTDLIIDDIRSSDNSNIEVLWPEEFNEHDVELYLSDMKASIDEQRSSTLFRPVVLSSQEKIFSSLESRRVVERAFLKKGIYIATASQNSAPSMRPLGFMKRPSLGFGTLFITYRNIANNCPLVLWWGDTKMPSSHPFSKWYPLFPRRTNSKNNQSML